MDDPQRELKQWLAEKVSPHGEAKRLADATGLSSDKITRSKELESSDPKKRRTLQYEEIRAIAMYFHELPPGYEGMKQWLRDADATMPERQVGDVKPQPLTPLAGAIHNARKRRGASIRDVARATGKSIDAVVAWEDGVSSPDRDQLEAIAAFLRVDARALERGIVAATDSEELGDATFVSDELPRYVGPRDVEKLGVVAAGDDGDFEFNGKVAEYVPRPKGLADRPGVFSLEIISDSMYPAYRKFDPIFCDRLEPQIGDDVVIETFPEEGASVGKAFVKRLKKRTNSTIVVEQFNPPKEITFDPYAIKHLWRVVPHRELHGL